MWEENCDFQGNISQKLLTLLRVFLIRFFKCFLLGYKNTQSNSETEFFRRVILCDTTYRSGIFNKKLMKDHLIHKFFEKYSFKVVQNLS